MINREKVLKKIESNINKNGFSVTIVTGGDLPRFAYTIGLRDKLNYELIFAGGEFFSANDITMIFQNIVVNPECNALEVATLGNFTRSKVHPTWSAIMMLGVFDFYNQEEVEAWQILPDREHFTLDIPILSKEFNSNSEPIWKWLVSEWNYPVPKDSTVVTNLAALKGEKITEVMRWEENEWEMFAGAGPDVPKEEMRVVSLGTLLGIDQTLSTAVNLSVGKGLWRNPVDLVWNDWR